MSFIAAKVWKVGRHFSWWNSFLKVIDFWFAYYLCTCSLHTYYTEHLYLSNLYNYEFLERLGNQADGKSRLWSLKPLEILSVKLGEVCLPIYVNRNLKLSILHSKVRHFEFYKWKWFFFLLKKGTVKVGNTIYLETDTSMFLSNGMHCISNDSDCHFCCYI